MDERLTLQDLVDILAKKQDITKKDAETFLRELIAVISENIEKNDPVKIRDFGTFKLVKVNARRSVDVNTGEAIEIPAHYKLSFIPDKSLKEAVNRPFAHFESVVLEDGVTFDNLESSEETENIAEEEEATVNELEEEKSVVVPPPTIILNERQEEIQENADLDEPDAIVEEVIAEEDSRAMEEIVETVGEHVEEDLLEPIDRQPEITPDSQESNTSEAEVVADKENVESQDKPAIRKDFVPKVAKKIDETSETESEKIFESHQRKTRRRRFISLGFIVFFIISGFAIGGLYLQEIMGFFFEHPVEDKSKNVTNMIDKTITDSVAVVVNSADSLDTNKPDKSLTDFSPIGTETIKSGHTLRLISLKYYGNRSFWPYIYEENKDLIKNPNNVPLGTELAIPSPDKYGIDADNNESLEKARVLEEKLIKELGL